MDANGRDVRSDGGAGGVDWAGRRQAERQLHGGRSLRKDRYSRIVGGMGVSGGGDVARNELAEPGDGGRRGQRGRRAAGGGPCAPFELVCKVACASCGVKSTDEKDSRHFDEAESCWRLASREKDKRALYLPMFVCGNHRMIRPSSFHRL